MEEFVITIGLGVWIGFLGIIYTFVLLCILSLFLVPVQAFFALRFVLGQKGFYLAKIFFSAFAVLLLFGALKVLARAYLYSRQDYIPVILFQHVMFNPWQALAYAAFELFFFFFKEFTRENENPAPPG